MIHCKIYNTINDVPNSWNELPNYDLFLKTPFLRALEQSLPSNISAYYLGVFKEDDLVGVVIIQRVQLYIHDVFRKTSSNIVKHCTKHALSSIVRGNALVVGNLMHTGQHGLFYLSDKISEAVFLDTVFEGIELICEKIKKEFNKKIRIIAFKDYFESDSIHHNSSFFKKHNLHKAQVQPNMIFAIPKNWKTQQDYFTNFNKKYRDRYKSARKKGNSIVKSELSLDDIKTHSDTLFMLYENVSDNARVNSFKLHKNHLYELKLNLENTFKVFGYFLNNELIGFFTLMLNGTELETYFLGYNQDLQHKHQLYLNMLYDMAIYGIENNFENVVFARTAMEIKSSIGAKPHNMHIYINHTNSVVSNTIVRLSVKYLNPVRKWDERNPFK